MPVFPAKGLQRGLIHAAGVALLLALPGCSLFEDDDPKLEGTRIPVREPETVAAPAAATAADPALPPVTQNADWTHRSATPSHVMPNAALGAGLSLVWSVDAGDAGSSRARLTAAPIVAEGRIYTLDAAAGVRAFDPSGSLIWSVSVAREGEDGRDGYGGGLAFDSGRLYVTTGFGEVLALNPATGESVWRRAVEGPIRSAPTVMRGRVFVVTREEMAFGLDAATGEEVWRIQGAAGTTGLLGGASPAADDVLAVLPFASGEVTAVIGLSGRRVWTAAIAGGRRGLARADIGDISSDPVIIGDIVLAANQSGRLVSIDRRTGDRNWTANDGSVNTVLPAGGSLYLLSDTAELLRLDLATGTRIWGVQLAEFDSPDDRSDVIAYGGPVLAGGRLILTSSDGSLISFDPATGAETGRVRLPGGSYLPPAVAGGRLYVMTLDGELAAFQ